jgi:hypothetical protein
MQAAVAAVRKHLAPLALAAQVAVALVQQLLRQPLAQPIPAGVAVAVDLGRQLNVQQAAPAAPAS